MIKAILLFLTFETLCEIAFKNSATLDFLLLLQNTLIFLLNQFSV